MAPRRFGPALLLLAFAAPAFAADWPMWRHDAARSAASPQELPARLHLHWVRHELPLTPAWPDQSMMPFDAAYEPVVAGHMLFFGSSRSDSITAVDTATGEERWRFHAEGPVRFAPLVWEQRVYFVSDDGYLYCVDAGRGRLIWKFRGGPSDRKVLGNGRLISTWPARGAPVIADGTVYFAASIWPFMGIFIHALDARTGAVKWTNDGDGSIYIKQPHSADSFAGVAPQGPMAIVGDKLLVTGGRSVPACYDRRTGKLLHYLLNENSKKGGGSTVAAVGKFFFSGGGAFELETGKHLGKMPATCALTEEAAYGFQNGELKVYDLANAKVSRRWTATKWSVRELAANPLPDVQDVIKAGSRLYLGLPKKVMAVVPPSKREALKVEWEAEINGTVARLIAADDRLVVVTLEGGIYCFGAEYARPKVHRPIPPSIPIDVATERARVILDTTRVRDGYAVVWGVGNGRLAEELAHQSKLHVIAIDPDIQKVKSARDRLIALGLYGERVAVHLGDSQTFDLPPYFASLMVAEDVGGMPTSDAGLVADLFNALRPYGGTAFLPLRAAEQTRLSQVVLGSKLAGAEVSPTPAGTLLRRVGPLPGAGNWTHEHADAANTRVSTDRLVKAPLGLLWFGGPTHEGILPRHGHGPQPQIIDGRQIIEGIDKLRAIDIYTGRLLWEAPLPGVGSRFNNLAHQPGANAGGTNYISTSSGIYVAYRDSCMVLDPETGRRVGEFRLSSDDGSTTRWAYINVEGDYLIGGAGLESDLPPEEAAGAPRVTAAEPKTPADAPRVKITWKQYRSAADGQASSTRLVIMDRHSGKVLWQAQAAGGFRHNAFCVGGGRLYAVDRAPAMMKKSETSKPTLIAFDLKTGARLWQADIDVFGTFLSYSVKHDVLVESGRVARDTLPDEPKGMRAYRADSGKVLWYDAKVIGPAMLHSDVIIRDKGATELLTGRPVKKPDPITGEPIEWTWTRNYGCNTPAAAEHLMTFRSGAAGYCDLLGDSGTGNFGGIRSGCTNNLIVAGGVISSPDYTRTCTCSYQNQTSLALVPVPETEMWTSFGKREAKGAVRRLGLNFGAPGDRRADDGTLWLDYPSVGGASPAVNVKVAGARLQYFRRHSSRVQGGVPWVAASGVMGVEEVAIGLGPKGSGPRRYTVRLHFAEPEAIRPGERVFDVAIQGQQVLDDLDIVRDAGGADRGLVKEIPAVVVSDALTIRFMPTRGVSRPPLICGIEIVAAGRAERAKSPNPD